LTRNIKLTIEYDGSNYFGFQYQKDGLLTIQGEIEKALEKLTTKQHTIIVAGRTDKGVHARAQVCNFITECNYPMIAFLDGLNRFLPKDIAVIKAEDVSLDFNSRFSARARKYEYYILNRRAKSAIHHKRITLIKEPLDIEKMQQAANLLVGEHDFSSFRAAACQAKSPITNIYSIKLEKQNFGDDVVIKTSIHGRAFLHNMVRIIMGTLVEVGMHRQPIEYAKQALEAKNRDAAGITLAPHGLFFVGVDYNDNGKLNHDVYDYEPKIIAKAD
jgi:tRNA pseudouridine38-40 synthase